MLIEESKIIENWKIRGRNGSRIYRRWKRDWFILGRSYALYLNFQHLLEIAIVGNGMFFSVLARSRQVRRERRMKKGKEEESRKSGVKFVTHGNFCDPLYKTTSTWSAASGDIIAARHRVAGPRGASHPLSRGIFVNAHRSPLSPLLSAFGTGENIQSPFRMPDE